MYGCLTDDEIKDFLRWDLPGDQMQYASDHITACSDCQSRARKIQDSITLERKRNDAIDPTNHSLVWL